MLGSVTGSAVSTGCFSLEHLRRRGRERVNADENKEAKQKAWNESIFNVKQT